MRELAAFDWSSVKPALDAYVTQAVAAATPLQRRRETEARELLFAHFCENRSAYERFNHSDWEEMVGLLMEGVDIGIALHTVLQAKAGSIERQARKKLYEKRNDPSRETHCAGQ